jgi:hypothetical protein
MAELKFDHTKDVDFLEVLGMSEEDMKDLNMKFAKISKFLITKDHKKSELIEEIAKTFSYNELLLATTFFLMDKTAQIIEENPVITLLSALSNLKNQNKK